MTFQQPIQSILKSEGSACTADSNKLPMSVCSEAQHCPVKSKSDFHEVLLVVKLPKLHARPLAAHRREDELRGGLSTLGEGIALNAPECASAECPCPALLAGIQADPLPSLYTSAYHMPW